jgi:tetratricopeptide (TPR) repeat protein
MRRTLTATRCLDQARRSAMVAILLAAGLGSVHFTATGSPACKANVLQGVLLLHSFVYDEAREAFGKADCPIARWGEAMTYDHPLWGEENLAAGRAALARLTAAKVSTLETGLIEAARALYGEGDWEARHEAWLSKLAELHARLPQDDEAALFHALALYVCSHHGKDVKRAMEAVAIAQDVFARNPDHPGAAHYLIHAADTPDHAILALKAARRYARIAPASSHALHMPSHIFVQLGMWKDVESSNLAAFTASEKRPRPDWHSYRWLAAARLELDKPQLVLPMLEMLRERMSREKSAELRWVYAQMAQMVLAQGAFDEKLLAPLHDLPGEEDTAGGHIPYKLYAQSSELEARLEHAALQGDEAKARELAASLEALKLSPERVRLLSAARIAQARSVRDPGSLNDATLATRALADFDDAQPVSGPAESTPAREQLGDLLMRTHRYLEAEREFQKALEVRPNRLHALKGLHESALGAGEPQIASSAQARIAQQVR